MERLGSASNQTTSSTPQTTTNSTLEESSSTPLQNSWCFWHYKPPGPSPTPEEYEAAIKILCNFASIEGFWRCFNNLPTTDQLRIKWSFHMMKEGVRPLWEDPSNANGGFWVLRVRREDTQTVWKELLLAVIGEQFCEHLGEGDEICGVTVAIRPADSIIELWNKNASESNSTRILRRIQEVLGSNIEIRTPYYKINREHLAFGAVVTNKNH